MQRTLLNPYLDLNFRPLVIPPRQNGPVAERPAPEQQSAVINPPAPIGILQRLHARIMQGWGSLSRALQGGGQAVKMPAVPDLPDEQPEPDAQARLFFPDEQEVREQAKTFFESSPELAEELWERFQEAVRKQDARQLKQVLDSTRDMTHEPVVPMVPKKRPEPAIQAVLLFPDDFEQSQKIQAVFETYPNLAKDAWVEYNSALNAGNPEVAIKKIQENHKQMAELEGWELRAMDGFLGDSSDSESEDISSEDANREIQ